MNKNKLLLLAIFLFLLSSLFISDVHNYFLRILWDCIGFVLGILGLIYALEAIYRKFIKGLSLRKIAIAIAANVILFSLIGAYFEFRAYRTGIIDKAQLAAQHSEDAEMLLGNNIKIGVPRGIEISELSGSGTINITAYISGDRSKRKIYIHGIESKYRWELDSIEILLDGSQILTIRESKS